MPRSFDRESQHFERHSSRQSANELAGLLAVLGVNLAPSMWNAIKNNRNLEEKVRQWAQSKIDEYTEDQKWKREREPKPRINPDTLEPYFLSLDGGPQTITPRRDDSHLRNPFYNPETDQGRAYEEVNSETPHAVYLKGDPRNVTPRFENLYDDIRNVIWPSNLSLK